MVRINKNGRIWLDLTVTGLYEEKDVAGKNYSY